MEPHHSPCPLTRTRRASRTWLTALLGAALPLLALLGTPAPAAAQGGPRSLLFNTDNLPFGDGATTEPGARRARLIRLNAAAVVEGDSPLRQPAPAGFDLDSSRMELNLFNDTLITAALEKTVYRNGTNFIATGVVDGFAQSRVIIVAEGEVLAATIDVPGLGLYQIRYAGDGFHKIVEVDKARVPNCGPLKKAPAKPKPIKVRKKITKPIVGSEPGPFVEITEPLLTGNIFAPSSDPDPMPPPLEGDPATNTVIDIMVVYTAASRTGAGGVAAMNATIDLAMTEANEALANSLVPVTLNLVFRGEVPYTETGTASTDLTRLQNSSDGYMDSVHNWRNQYGADMVCLFTESMNTYAGLGYLMTSVSTNFSSYAFSVVRRVYATGTYTFAHELGHNLGCAHDRANSSSQGAYNYSYGHRFVGSDSMTYRSVMAYAPGTRIPYFSNPGVSYLGTPTGIAPGTNTSAANALSISNVAPTAAAFRTAVVIFSLTSSSNSVAETNGTFTIDVTRLSVTNVTATVDYTVTAGTATDGSDFVSTNGTLSFAAGQTNKTITVAVLDDALKENPETFVISLSNPSVGTLSLSNSTAYITDDDISYVGFTGTNIVVAEDTNTVTFTVVRTGMTNTAVTINYFTTNSTALAGSDYVATNGLLSFAPGVTTNTFTVTVLDDALNENRENFLVRLRTPTNTALAAITNFTVTINTNDSAIIAFAPVTNSVTEVDGTNSTNVTITVVRTGTAFNACSVSFYTTNLTAVLSNDYTPTNGTISFATGESNKTITLEILGDDLLEVNETLRVVLHSPSDARVTFGTNTVTILDNDAAAISFAAITNSVSETNSSLLLILTRTGVTNTAVSVDFFTTNVSAAAGSDYSATNGTLSFAAGVVSNSITITLSDDALQETNEVFLVRLVSATNVNIGTLTNRVTILDDDASTVGFTVAALTVAEDTNSVTLTIVRTGSTNTAVSANFSIATNGTARAGLDYIATNGILSFAAGVTTNMFAVAIINDSLAESNEVINVRLSSATNCSLGTTNLAITITTNDAAYIAFAPATTSFTETNDTNATITLTVNRTGTTFNQATVNFTTTNGTATAGTDYLATNGTLTFAAGVTTTQIVVSILNDDLSESNETFRVILSTVADGTLTIATNVVTLSDDDGSTIAFTTNAVTLAEESTNMTFHVQRTGMTNTAVAVDFWTTNGSALAASDYVATNGTLYFAPGVVSNSFIVDLVDDLNLETNEVFRVRLSGVTNASLGLATNTITITNNDYATVAFEVATVSVAEDSNSLTVAVIRGGATNTTVSVRFSTTNGTALVNSDYFATNGVLSFVPGVTTNTFAVRVINDGIAEANETINVRLTNPTNTALTTSNLVITVTTNDSSIIAFAATTTSFTETNSTNNTITLTVNRTGTTNNLVTVNFATTNVTALATNDYLATNGTLTFAAGVITTQIVVAIVNDDLQESNETFRVVLNGVLDGTIGTGTNLVTVTDDDVSTVGLDTNAVTIAEAGTNVTLTILRGGATNTAVAVNFTTTNLSATGGVDYGATNGTLSFAPGVVTNTITIAITDDATLETNETFRFVLSGVTNSTLLTGTNTLTITDDDSNSTGFLTNAIAVAENTNSVTIYVVRTGATNTSATVRFSTTNGTAVASGDYSVTNGILSFAPGVTTNTFTVSINDDLLAEGSETINVRLTNPTNTSLTTSNLVITITTNDSSVIALAAATTSFTETNSTNNTITLTVNRTGTTNNLATVGFTTTNVTALAGGDYLATNGTLTFAAGVITTQIVISVSNDELQESNETFRVVLSAPVDATLGIGTNVVTLADDDVSTVGLTTNVVTVAETGTNVTLTILRTGATNTSVAVNFATTNIGASGTADYVATNGTLSFAPGETTNTVTISITDDALQETNETFRFVLSGVTNSTLLIGTNTLTITDDDASVVTLLTNVFSVAENTNSITITVIRTGATNTAVTANFTTTNGTALAGSDYFLTNGILSFAPGVTTNTFTVRIIDDLIPEGNETLLVRLLNPTNTTPGVSNLTITITTNDSSVISLATTTTSFTETNDTNATITLTVNRTGTTNNTATVNFTSTNVTAATGSDYLGTNGTLTFAPGVITTQIVVAILFDELQESNETFRVVLSSPVDGIITNGTNVITLADDDVSTLRFDTNAVTVAENGTNVLFTLTRSGATNTAVAVDFATTNGTATSVSDYGATNGTLSFAPGVTSNSFTVNITDDLLLEATEQFLARLSGATNTTLTIASNSITVTDDDVAGVGFAAATLSVAEDTNNVTIYVLRTGTTNTTCSVAFFTTNGSATAGSDFAATNGVLTYPPGLVTNSFVVRVINDGLAEGNETFTLRLANATNISLSTSNMVITITTNDSAFIGIASATTSFTETNSTNATITLTVNRTGTTNNLATVDFTTTNVLALAGSDYVATNGTLTFAAGVITTQIVVSISNDDLQESNETFRVVLSNPSDSTITNGTNVITLVDDDGSTVGLDTNAVAVAETGTNVTLTILRTGATNTAVAVDFTTTTNGLTLSATGGTDYVVTNGTLSFAPGVTTNTITISITDDALQEGNETFRFVLSAATNSTLATATSTNTITDDDASTVTLLTNVLSVAENTNSITITVIRTGATNTAVTANFATSNGVALAGSDYYATNGILSFAAGVTTNTFTVRVIDDLIAEGNETFSVRLLSPTNTSLGTNSMTITITTNDSAVISLASATTSFTETNSTNATITLTVNRTGTTNNLATVDFTTTNVTALAGGDYVATNGTLTFAAGVITTQIVISVSNDDLQESNETFRVVLSAPIDATISVGTNVVTLVDDDNSTVGLDTNAVTVAETGTNVTFTILRGGATNSAVAVDFTTTNVTATGGTDYTATNGTLSFAPGVTTNTITLAITDDALQEGNETFRLVFSGVTNSTLVIGTNTATITDDDASTVTLLTNVLSVAEDTNSITITVIRTGATNTAVTANFATSNGVALAGSDYYATNGILSFAPGVTTNTFTLRIIDDLIAEGNEALTLRLLTPTNTSLGTSSMTITITTNDSAVISFASATTSFTETNSTNATITLTVNRTGTTNNLVTVDFTTTNVLALADSDYTATNGTLTFAAGVITTQIVVSVLNDDLQESNETFRVILSVPDDATISIGTNVVTIADDDNSAVGLDTNAVAVAETGTNVTFTIVRSGATNTAVAVDFATSNGLTLTATAGTDYTGTNGTLSFAPGVTTNTITLAVADDASQEGNETFRLILSGLTNSTLATSTNTATITDDDASSVSFWTNAVTVYENTNVITIYALRSGATNTAVSVNFTNLSTSTAIAGIDFTATNGTLSFAPGVTTNTFTLTIIDDGAAEIHEYVNYRLQNPTNTSLVTSNLVVTITTNDSAVISLATATTSFTETNDTNATITLTVNRTGTTFNQCTVNFTTTNVSATAGGDYTATNGTLTFAAGVTTTQIVVSILFDDLQETNETFRVVLSSPVDATIGTGTNVVTITDDDVSGVDLTASTISVAETGTNVTFTIIRTGATNTAVAVDFTTTNVTATAGSDYTATNDTLYFAPGVTTNTVTVSIADDLLYEGNESFRLLLIDATNTTAGIATNTATITDDDLSTLTFETDADSVSELDGTIDILVSRTGVTNTVISVAYFTTNLTATPGTDYISTNGVLSFAAGETQKTITVAIVFDGPVESAETFRVRLVNFTNTAAGAETNLTVTINDAFGDGGGFAPASTVPVAISAINAVGTNDLRLHITGPAGAPFVIETTTDFQTWTPVSTNYVRTTGTDWLTPIDRTVPARYFRVVRPQ